MKEAGCLEVPGLKGKEEGASAQPAQQRHIFSREKIIKIETILDSRTIRSR